MSKATTTDFRDSYRSRIADLKPRHPPYGQHNLRQWLMLKAPENLSQSNKTIWREEVERACGGILNNQERLF